MDCFRLCLRNDVAPCSSLRAVYGEAIHTNFYPFVYNPKILCYLCLLIFLK